MDKLVNIEDPDKREARDSGAATDDDPEVILPLRVVVASNLTTLVFDIFLAWKRVFDNLLER